MELFRNIRLKIGNAILRKKLSRTKRSLFYSNISMVKTIGIVWDASNPDDFDSLSRFHQKMLERKIEVKIVGYYPKKELPDRYTAIRYLSLIKSNELNYFYIPVASEVNSFITNKFDILIDINFNNQFTVQYLSVLSAASFKVGLYENDNAALNNHFDMMMEIKKPVDLENYLNQIIHYLGMIDSGSTIKAEKLEIK